MFATCVAAWHNLLIETRRSPIGVTRFALWYGAPRYALCSYPQARVNKLLSLLNYHITTNCVTLGYTTARDLANDCWIACNPRDAAPSILGLSICSRTLNGTPSKVLTNKKIFFSCFCNNEKSGKRKVVADTRTGSLPKCMMLCDHHWCNAQNGNFPTGFSSSHEIIDIVAWRVGTYYCTLTPSDLIDNQCNRNWCYQSCEMAM